MDPLRGIQILHQYKRGVGSKSQARSLCGFWVPSFLGASMSMSCQIWKPPVSTFYLHRTNGSLSPRRTSLRDAEWSKKVEDHNGGVESVEEKEVAMVEKVVEEMEVTKEVVVEKVEEMENVVEEGSKMVRWGSSPNSTHLEHC